MRETPEIQRHHRTIPLSPIASTGALRLFFGGSFDPPHLGHTRLPPMVLAAMGSQPARIVYVPAARSPHKHTRPIASHHRLAMLALAVAQIPDAEIWEQELSDAPLNPDQPSYWADTWAIVQSMHLPGTNRFLIGADQALSMHRWHRYSEYWQDAVVMLRAQRDNPDTLIERLDALGVWSSKQLEHWRSLVVPVETIDASSTAIRDALGNPSRRKNPIAGLDDRVHQYILEHGLYTLA